MFLSVPPPLSSTTTATAAAAAILVGVKWSLIVVLIISLMINDAEPCFTSFVSHLYIFRKLFTQAFYPFLSWLSCLLLLGSSSILNTDNIL